ncbi:CPBP family intramembrane glutamic endopeptidase [Microbacterium sp. CH12i]|uniref:CPBP family intramembrane glutamic endopeptidase n=1 Tax=Microbacterium sp. CH12i TaxID=1479651 RepID=UPI0006894C10|nr:CPBP family intramembrane glutamic endopeptidase [Microbacterium sp. CH12i]
MHKWGSDLIGWAALGLGAGILLGAWLGGIVGTVALWVGMLVPVLLAFRRGVPRGLLRFRGVDLLYGFVLAGILRVVQGWLVVAFGGSGALPSYPSLGGQLPTLWWLEDLIGGVVVAPVIEEFFFRGLLLVCIFTLVRRFAGGEQGSIGIAGFVSVVASAGLFMLTHQLVSPLTPDAAVSLMLLSVVGGLLVVFTGRIWPAVLLHIFFNGTGVLLMVAGTLLG